ncbi:MAG: hypothetical protein Q8K47_01245, partial [Nitrosomonas sp.]|nr:hypothetical protein [Nitrosomonas sp.]
MNANVNVHFSSNASEEPVPRAQTTLDPNATQVIVLNRDGIIVAVNESWRRFSVENDTDPGKLAMHMEIGANYLDVSKVNLEAYEGILMVLDGRLPNF